MDKTAIYCRLSKEDEEKKEAGEESESIQNQKIILTEFAARNGFLIYEVYIDDDYSGLDRDRPSFNKMIENAKSGCFNTIICKSQSRFTRDMELVEKYIHGLFPLWGVRFIGVVDNVDTSVKGNKKARQINGLINEWYCEDLSENIRRVFQSKMEQGQFLGSFAPYGYTKDATDRHKLTIDEEAAEVVKKIFGWYLEGLGSQKIRNKLYEENIPPPSIYKKQKMPNFFHPSLNYEYTTRYGMWAKSTIKRILSDEVYIGSIVQGKERKVSYKSKKVVSVPRQQWVVVPNCHPPIICKADFEIVQKMLKENRYETGNKNRYQKEIYIFSGKVYCKHCGNKMVRVVGRNAKAYLYCQIFSRSGGKECKHNSITEAELTHTVLEKINVMVEDSLKVKENRRELLRIFEEEGIQRENEEKHKIKEVDFLKEKAESIKKALAMLYVEKSAGKVKEKEYSFLKENLMEEMDEIEKKLRLLQEQIAKMRDETKGTQGPRTILEKYGAFYELTMPMVNYFVDYIEIDTQENAKEVTIHWNV